MIANSRYCLRASNTIVQAEAVSVSIRVADVSVATGVCMLIATLLFSEILPWFQDANLLVSSLGNKSSSDSAALAFIVI